MTSGPLLRYSHALMPPTKRLLCTVQARDSWSSARALELTTRHGLVQTPVFMPVATHASLRHLELTVAESLDYPVLLANTYHLLIRPGPEVLKKVGGIHPFMRWNGSVLTDSGGFQLFSLSNQLSMTEEGAVFRSYTDGRQIKLTPELSIEMQGIIGSDIMMVLDHCIPSTESETAARAALELTTRWAKRSFLARGDSDQALFGIVQGACYPHLRRESAAQITEIPFDGFALGGLAVGESKAEREDTTEFAAQLLPDDQPRYLMGVGTPIDLLESVRRGIDMFDCILPTSLAAQGSCFTSHGKVDLRRGVYRASEIPLDCNCSCSTCTRFSRAYLHHLVQVKEPIVAQLLSIHNLHFYRELMRRMRQAILEGSFQALYNREAGLLAAPDLDNPPQPPRPKKGPSRFIRGEYEVLCHLVEGSRAAIGAIKHRSSGESMHRTSDPSVEAHALYVEQPNLVFQASCSGEPLVIWDIGLGAATNVMACIRTLEQQGVVRSVRIISFERDLDPLRLALTHPRFFPHLHHPAPQQLLRNGKWHSQKIDLKWELCEGDLLELLIQPQQLADLPAPEIIWHDPFSTKVDSELWSVVAFQALLRATAQKHTRLFTYSNSTAVRASMLVAGWYVGRGIAMPPKSETTIAYSPSSVEAGEAQALLDHSWLSRWERSHTKEPIGAAGIDFEAAIRGHQQFVGGLC